MALAVFPCDAFSFLNPATSSLVIPAARSSMSRSFATLRVENQQVRETLKPGTISIGALSYDCFVDVSDFTWVPRSEGNGWRRRQTLTVKVFKTVLEVPPARATMIVFNGISYNVTAIGGNAAEDVAWKLDAEYFIL